MKRRDFIQSTTLAGLPLISIKQSDTFAPSDVKRKIFIFGGGRDKVITRYLISLTQKENPKICFVPTATGDSLADDYFLVCFL